MKIKEVYLESVQLKAKIIIFDEKKGLKELNTSTLMTRNGLISKTFYEDVLLQTCVANFMQLTLGIYQHVSLINNIDKFREELLNVIYSLNPHFIPEKLYITDNGQFTLDEKDGVIKLVDNKVWDEPVEDILEQAFSETNQLDNDLLDLKTPFEDLEYEIVPKWWDRLRSYIKIKKFSKKDCELIVKADYPDKSSFEATVVLTCIEDFEGLYKTIESYGITNRVPAPALLHELYLLCVKVNPTLTFKGSEKTLNSNQVKRQTHAKKPKKRFKDVPDQLLLNLEDKLKEKVIGQDHAISKVVEAIKRAKVGLKDPGSPIGTFIFTGFSGSGKTYLSKILAEELMGSKEHLIRIDCSEYSADHEYAKLIGSPAGYIGFEQGGLLTNAITERPFSIVLFDEIEKASSKVHELMLQIMDDGILTDNKGKKVSFDDVIVIMTSNVGVDELEKLSKTPGFVSDLITDDKKNIALNEAIKKKFKPEFINRIDEIIHFNMLTEDDYNKIIDLELRKVLDLVAKSKQINIVYDDSVRELLLKNGIDSKFGARPLKRCIKKFFSNPLADQILKGNIKENDKIKATVKNEKIYFRKMNDRKPPFYLSKKMEG